MAIQAFSSFIKSRFALPMVSIAFIVTAVVSEIPGRWFGMISGNANSGAAARIGTLEPQTSSPGAEFSSLAVSPDGALLATAAFDGGVQLWDASTLRSVARWQAHSGEVSALAFAANSTCLLTAGVDRSVAHWDLVRLDRPELVVRWNSWGYVTAVALAPDGQTVAIACGDRLALHDARHGEPLPQGELCVPGAPIRALSFAPDSYVLASGGGGDCAIRLWGVSSGRPVLQRTLVNNTDQWVRSLAYSTDGAKLLSLDTVGHLVAWDRDGRLIGEFRAGPLSSSLASLGDGGQLLLAKGGAESTVYLWRLPESGRH
jgi:WD40 repeat protein